MLDQPGGLVVSEDRQPVSGSGVPAALPGAIHLCRADREVGISNVKEGNLRIRGDRHDTSKGDVHRGHRRRLGACLVVLVSRRTEIDKRFRVLACGHPRVEPLLSHRNGELTAMPWEYPRV